MTINSLRNEFIKKYNMDECNILEKKIDNITFIFMFFEIFIEKFIKDLKIKYKTYKPRSLCVEASIKKLAFDKIQDDKKYVITMKKIRMNNMPRHLYREIYVLI